MPDAPPILSTTIGWPSSSPIFCAWMRALTSTPPPAANGTASVSGRVGQSCAAVAVANNAPASAQAIDHPTLIAFYPSIFADALFRRDPGSLDGGAPGFDLAFDKRLQVLRRALFRRRQAGAKLLQARLHLGRRPRRDAPGVELGDDRRRCRLRQKDGVPAIGVHVGEALFLGGRNVRKGRRSLGAQHHRRLDLMR